MTQAESADATTYVMYAVFRVRGPLGDVDRADIAAEADAVLDHAAEGGVVTRGVYNVSGFRYDADYMFWWNAHRPEALQEVYNRFRRTTLAQASEPVWSAIGLHRPAEFKKGHAPALVYGTEPKRYVSVYPYNRTNEWYLLPPEERSELLTEHGRMGREYPDIAPNTVHNFALGDYEFLLAFECDELHHIVEMMRHLRGAGARRYTRLETPFFAGPRCPLSELVATLP